MSERDCLVGVFESTSRAHEAVAEILDNGWSPDNISVIARGNEGDLDAVGPVRQGDHMEKSALIGGATGAALGLLAGSSLFIIPGIGPVLFAGAMASGITGGLVGGLVGAMSGWGIKHPHILDYERALRKGKALVVLTGDPASLAAAEDDLRAAHAEHTTLHAESADSASIDP